MIGAHVYTGTTIYTVILMILIANALFVFLPSFIISEIKKSVKKLSNKITQ